MGRKKIEIDLAEVERLASIGLNESQVSDALGISVATLGNRKKDSSDFYDALKRGKAAGIATVANNLFDQSAEGNVSAGIFYMKNRAGWTDKQQMDANVSVTDMSEEEALKYFNGMNIQPETDA